MEAEYGRMLLHLCLAVLAGGLIGLERTYHGRPAGFRTHTLVCTASSLLMQLTLYQTQLLPNLPPQYCSTSRYQLHWARCAAWRR